MRRFQASSAPSWKAVLFLGLALGVLFSLGLALSADASSRMSAWLQGETATPTETPVPSQTATDAESPTATKTPQDVTSTDEPSVTASATETGTPVPESTATPTPATPLPEYWLTGSTFNYVLFGHSVNTAGDVNGDGFDDVLIGAPWHHEPESYEGAAYLYLGSPSGPESYPIWSVQSNQTNGALGFSVDTAGDVNGDGFADILVGAPPYSSGGQNEGAAFAYYGSPAGPGTTPDWTAQGDQASGYVGSSVSGAGDVNGDGFDDVVIGAPFYDNGQTDEGRAFLYLGSASGLGTTPAWTGEIDVVEAGFGYNVCSAGDVDGDGYDDVLITSYYVVPGQVDGGKAHLFLGSAVGLKSTPDWVGETGISRDGYGRVASGAGDVNRDGYADILVGAPGPQESADSSIEGKAYLYLGSPQGPSVTADWTTAEGTGYTSFGTSLSSAGDFNADGYDDVIVGDSRFIVDPEIQGAIFVYLGGASGPDATYDFWFSSWGADPLFGYAVGWAGNVDGDAYDDVIVGAPIWTSPPYPGGRALLFFGEALSQAPTSVHRHAGCDANADFYSHEDCDSDADPHPDSNADFDADPNSHLHAQSNPDAIAHIDTYHPAGCDLFRRLRTRRPVGLVGGRGRRWGP